MTELQRTGFFREMPHGQPTDPSLAEARGAIAAPHEDRITAYLEAGHVYIATPGYTYDVLDPGKRIGPPHYQTDGRFVWPGDLAHYVRTYHVRLDGRFLEHVVANHWTVPADVDITAVALPRTQTAGPAAPGAAPAPITAAAPAAPAPLTTAAPAVSAPPEIPLDQYPLQALIEAVGKVVARQQGFEGEPLRRHVSGFIGHVQTLMKMFEIKLQEDRQRERSSAEVERLIDGIVRTGTSAGNAIASHRDAIVQAFRGVELAQVSSGVRVLVQWLQNPTAETHQPVQQLLENLQSVLGTITNAPSPDGGDPNIERMHREMRASLIQMFGQSFGQAISGADKKPS